MKEPHFLDSVLEEIKKPEEPHFLDEALKRITEEPEEEPHILDETLRKIRTEQKEEKTYFWLDAWQKAQDAYAWMYPHGWRTIPEVWRPVLETAGFKIGDAATFLARLCPNQADLPPYPEQSLARQGLTLAQAASVIALGSLAGYTGITALSNLTKYLTYGRTDKIASEFAKANFEAIKAQNPQVRTPQDAINLTQSSLRIITQPKIETTYLPTTMQELTKLSEKLLTPLGKQASTAEFKTAMVDQIRTMFANAGVEPTTKILEPFTQTIEHYTGSPVSGIISKEYRAAVIDIINKNLPSMIDAAVDTGRSFLPFDRPVVPEDKTVEEIEELVDTTMRKPLTSEEISAEGKEASLLADEFTKKIEAEKAAELFPEKEVAPTRQMEMYRSELRRLEEAGITGREAERAAMKTAVLKYKPKEIAPRAEQLKWELGEPTIKGQKEFELRPEEKTVDVFIGEHQFKADADTYFKASEEANKSDSLVAKYAELTKQESQLRPGGMVKGINDDPRIVDLSERIYEAQGLTKEGKSPITPKTPNYKEVARLEREAQKIVESKIKEIAPKEIRPAPGTSAYIEWWKKLPKDEQDAEILRKRRPELERLVGSELEEMRAEVEEGKPGRRVRTETGEWMAQPSTYPDFVGEFGLTKKGILKAYDTKKGKTWDLLQDIARDRVALGYEHPKLGRVAPGVSKAESDYLLQMREISEEIPEKIVVNEHLGIAEAKKENKPGEVITEKDYAHLAGKYDGQKNPLDLTEFDKETLWWQEVDKELNSPLIKEQLTELETRMDGLKIVEDERAYFIRSMTSNRTNKLSELTQEEAVLMNNYLAGLPEYDPDLPIPTINPPESTPGMPTNFKGGLLSMVQNMESWAERMEAKYPKTKMFTNILHPAIEARRSLYRLRIKLAKKGLDAIKGLTKEEMRQIQDWAEEESKGVKHTITLSERQEKARAELLEGINEVADLVELAEEERVPGKGYLPRRYRKEFLERIGIRKRKYDFSPMPWDYLRNPKSFKPFFKYERTIEDAPKSARLDLFASYMQYINQGTQAHFRDVLEDTAKDIDLLPPKLKAYMRRWANLQAGMSGIGEQLWVNTLGEAHIPKNAALFIERGLMDLGYMGGLGLKVSFAGKNATQFLHALSEIPEQWVLYGLYKMFTKEGKEIWQKSGAQMHFGPYLTRSMPKAKGRWQKAKNGMMIFVQLSDQVNREPAYLADYYRTMHYGKLYQEGRMNWTDLIRKLDLKRYEEPFQDIIKGHLEKGEVEVASDLMGDRVQSYTNWRYWKMVSPMLLQEGGPLFQQFARWGFDNVDLMWRRRIERGTKLIKKGEVKAGMYQFSKILRHLFYIGLLGAAIYEGAKRVTGKEYQVSPLKLIQYLTMGSIPSGLMPVPGAIANAFQFAIHGLSGRDWLAAQKWTELKRGVRVFVPAGLSFRDWWEATKEETPGEAAMRIIYPQFRPEPGEKKRKWYEPKPRRTKGGKRQWYQPAGTKEKGAKKRWFE